MIEQPPGTKRDISFFWRGVQAAVSAMRSDQVYYGPVNSKPGIASHVNDVANFIEKEIPHA